MGARAETADSPQAKKKASGRKKATSGSKTKTPPRRRSSDQKHDALRHEVLGLSITAASFALFLALISFYPDDVSDTGRAALTGETGNLIGPVGAYIADIILTPESQAFFCPSTLLCRSLFLGREATPRTNSGRIGAPFVLSPVPLPHTWLSGR